MQSSQKDFEADMKSDSEITILTNSVKSITGHWSDGDPFVDAVEIKDVLGWEIKPEGLCKDDACIPINHEQNIKHNERYNLRTVAHLTGHPTLSSQELKAITIGQPADLRSSALRDKIAPDFVLPDIEGVDRAFSDWAGKKRLLVAFSSW
mgnify:FL=1|tara:strand:+ start:2875 stop:3324 length:450 start_codon:yes stop_codon:yes gene_type:complete